MKRIHKKKIYIYIRIKCLFLLRMKLIDNTVWNWIAYKTVLILYYHYNKIYMYNKIRNLNIEKI